MKKTKSSEGNILEMKIFTPNFDVEIKDTATSMDEKQIGKLLFSKNPFLWKKEVDQIKEISQRLGWLSLADSFTKNNNQIIEFAAVVKNEGFTHAVLLGMGGSSLCSEVARETFGTVEGYLKLLVLDNTAPEAIKELEKSIALETTLFIVASKSGNTQETNCFFHYFYQQLVNINKDAPGNNFIAITDAGTPLVNKALEYNFRKTFINPSDLGGRYSVLSDFGLVPMALMGININDLLTSAKQMEIACKEIPALNNPGISLGIILGICERHGRDKVTFVLSHSINSFGYWLEQLIAESTGKEGRGLIPVNGELLNAPEMYSDDRIFIYMYLATDDNEVNDKKLKVLEDAGHPIVKIKIENKIDLGGEYFRWEVATAIAGILININPFDQPNVEESKKNTSDLLNEWSKEKAFKNYTPLLKDEEIKVYGGKIVEQIADNHFETVGEFIYGLLSLEKVHDYIAFLPYFAMTDNRTNALQLLRYRIRNDYKMATTLLNGPRYLHSTGQLHKGGPDSGLYIIFMGDDMEELPIPNEQFGFATLHQAQALGDFRSLDDKGRRVIRIYLGEDIDLGLDQLLGSFMNERINQTRHLEI